MCHPREGTYLKAGISTINFPDDSSGVNVHGTMPLRWIQAGMLLLNLIVWVNAAAELAELVHAL